LATSDEERKRKRRATEKAYRQRPDVKASRRKARKKYESTLEYKAERKAYYLGRKKIVAAYAQRPEVKARKKARGQRPEVKAKRKAHEQRPEVKAKIKAYAQRPEVKARKKAHEQRPEVKATRKAYGQKKYYDLKLRVFTEYSKRVSNSKVPVCACCGYLDFRFLTLDHIISRKKLPAEEQVVSHNLWKYLEKKGYPKRYQVLCYNCNQTKSDKIDCPHKFDDSGPEARFQYA